MSTGARFRSTGTARKLSDNVELPKNYPNLTANGDLKTSGDTLASVQNLPAVLTDPRKGIISNISFSFVSISFGIILRVFNIIFCTKKSILFCRKTTRFFYSDMGRRFYRKSSHSSFTLRLSVVCGSLRKIPQKITKILPKTCSRRPT